MANPAAKPSKLYRWEDYEWYATDSAGRVAVSTSAGRGPIPVVVLKSREIADGLADAVWQRPSRCRATMLVSLPTPDDYIHFASRGFFAYDWQDAGGMVMTAHDNYNDETQGYIAMMWRAGPVALGLSGGLFFVLIRWAAGLTRVRILVFEEVERQNAEQGTPPSGGLAPPVSNMKTTEEPRSGS
jgi:hypothetical protein